jgi:hypothetical protein
MIELWKPIKEYEDHYEVSNLGNVRTKAHAVSCRGSKTRIVGSMIRKLCTNRNGYATITLSKNNVWFTATVHQLVAQAFLPEFIKGTELNHQDGDKTNNRATNLEVSNSSHNQLHAVSTGLKRKQGVSRFRNVIYVSNPRAVSRWAASIRHNGKSSYGWKTFMTEEEAARHVDFLLDSIGDTSRLRNFPTSHKCPTTIPRGVGRK